MKRIVFSTFVAGAALSIGCAQLQDSRMEARNKSMARAAWRNQGGAFQYAAHPVHFREGFIAGYSDIASGGDGCPPALPPKCYWSVAFQNPSGQERVKAWFDGWREGVAAAKRDGVASYGTVYVPEEYRNRGPDPNCPGGNCGNRVIVAPHPSPVPATGAAPAPPAPPVNNY
ncbi:MAG TPA: hypothetical protein VNC50_19405, partial [Planctomycetia bacterium]|nr:hypothetical protein [Planctomycetia bacterium]